MNKKIYLVLEDKHIFEGYAFGAEGEALGELVFTTGMGGYIETLTDPSYCGQVVMQTFPLIGNYGFISEDAQSDKVWLNGYVVREWCEEPSNFRCEKTIDTYLKENNVVGICGVDTRAVTQLLREQGVMNCKITQSLDGIDYDAVKEYKVCNALEKVSSKKEVLYKSEASKFKLAMLDFGCEANFVQQLASLGCDITLLPHNTKAQFILSGGFDGVVLSGGPGNPEENTAVIEEIKKLFGHIPIFAAGLGHQVLALAAGAKTFKMGHGHRGTNQPVKRIGDARTFVSNQNHGCAVDGGTLPPGAEISYINANDYTCEGIAYNDKNALSVQFRPSAQNMEFLFGKFSKMMGDKNNASE